MLFCRHSIFLPALRIFSQSGNSSAMTTCDHIDIAVVININADRMIVPMFVTSSGLRVTPDRGTETPDVQGLFRRNLSNASAVAPNDQARDADVSARCLKASIAAAPPHHPFCAQSHPRMRSAVSGLWPCVEELALPNPSNVSSPELPGEKSGCTIY
jgi:hypothetical protein